MTNIHALLKNHDWVLQCWDDRYGRGIWVMVAPHVNQVYEVREVMDGSDIESAVLGDYFDEEGVWLPVTHGATLSEALALLDDKIQHVVANETWRMSVEEALACVLEVNDGNYGLKVALANQMRALFQKK